MTPRPIVALVDYGAGNLTSVAKGLRAAGGDVRLAPTPDALAGADVIVVPGVGHFAATARLDGAWREALRVHIDAGRRVVGVCLGMQWLFDGSDEAPDLPGLGVFRGRCSLIRGSVKVPHVGWNLLAPRGASQALAPDSGGAYAYFTHSYAAPVVPETTAATTHGETFSAIVERDNVVGVQFHPEKSGRVGLQLLTRLLCSRAA